MTIRHIRFKRVAAAAVAVALGLGLSACSTDTPDGGTSTVSSGPVDGGTLYWAVETKLQSVNPHRNGQDKANPILRNAFSSYLHQLEDGTYEPWLAKAYDISSDGLTVTLTLREGVTFSDGTPFDAQAVVANFDKITSTGYLNSIPGGLKFLESYKGVGEDQVVFTLAKPDRLFLQYLSGTTSSPLSPASLKLDQSLLEAGGPELSGIGPFIVKSYTPNTELVYVKRADYAWPPDSLAGQTAARLDEVVYRTFPEGSTRTGALTQGQVQISSDIQPLDVSVFDGQPGFTYLRSAVGGSPYSLYFNVSKEPLNDIRVRQAFIKGFDLDAIVTSIYQGGFDRASAPVSVKGPYAVPDVLAPYATDIDAANALLDEAGWTERNGDGIRVKNGQTLTIRAVSGAPFVRESRDQLNIAIGAALKQNVGIDYDFQIVDTGTETERAQANDYEVFDNSYGGTDPAAAFDVLYYSDPSRGYIARGKFNDSEIDALIDQGRFTTDVESRKATYADLQKLIVEKAYGLPLYQTQDNLAFIAHVQGITIDGATGQPFGAYTIWLSS